MDRAKLYGMIGSALFCLLTFLLLIFIYMPELQKPEEDEGIMVSFGNHIDGLGFGDMIAQMEAEAAQPKLQRLPEPQDLIAQETEQSLVIPKQNPNTEPRRPSREEIQLQEQQARARQEAAAADARRRQEETAARQRQEAIDRAENLTGGAFGSGGGAGSGTTSGDTRQGNPAGAGTSGGHGWSLSGRSLLGSLATPAYPSNVEGRITVTIRVDANGNVTTVSIGSPTNISDAKTRDAALSAAKSTRFSEGSGVSVGTITYNFRLK